MYIYVYIYIYIYINIYIYIYIHIYIYIYIYYITNWGKTLQQIGANLLQIGTYIANQSNH